ncbi:MAG: hypothetical protein KBA31_10675 [Alphaproteobacteria bacterium]|nr:hypothetical protein [Alphaproteobacteria bacterium]
MDATLRLTAVLTLVVVSAAGCGASDAWYLGTYKIVRADRAPWNDAAFQPDAAEVATYLGGSVTIGKRIEGPGLLACPAPVYVLKKVKPGYLFQGGLAVGSNPEASADADATKLGFKRGQIEALETGCEAEIDYVFRDHDHAAFALDNMIYWLERQ